MLIFLANCFGVYFITGLFYFCLRLVNIKSTDLTKGDMVLLGLFLPYTLTYILTNSLVTHAITLNKRSKKTRLVKWWQTPISPK